MGNNTAHDGPQVSGPGLIFTQCHLKSAAFDADTFNRFYTDVHVPDVMATGAASGAARWKVADETNLDQYLALYKVKDMALCRSDAFKSIPMTHELLGTQSIHDWADLETRFYTFEDIREREKMGSEGTFWCHLLCLSVNRFTTNITTGYASTTKIISAGLQAPSEELSKEVDRWYREEHDEQMSKEPGWIRTTRYRLGYTSNPRRQGPEWMTIHEFGEGNKLGTTVRALVPMTDWTKSIMPKMEFIESAVWEKIATFQE
jgi:hypothetical protein